MVRPMKVLLGIAGGAEPLRTLETVAEWVEEAGDELTVAIVDGPSGAGPADEVEARVRGRLADLDLPAVIRRVDGDPGSRLLEIAEGEGFDAIALEGGTRSPMGKISLGDVAEFVLMNASVSVVLVR